MTGGVDQFTPVGPVDLLAADGVVSTISKSGHEGAMEELQAEMKLLNWHKLANEAALKAAIIRTKSLRAADSQVSGKGKGMPQNGLQEKAAWMSQVIEEEQRKPLQVSKDFVTTYAASQLQAEERLDAEVERHIDVLQGLRSKVSERETQRQRKLEYHEKASVLKEEKKLMAEGKYSQPGSSSSSAQGGEGRRQAKSTLSTVINSLDKLVELERRITGLENDSLYDRMGDTNFYPEVAATHAKEAVPSILGHGGDGQGGGANPVRGRGGAAAARQHRGAGASLQFTKKKEAATSRAPSQTTYSVKVNVRGGSKRRGGGGVSAGGSSVGGVRGGIPKAGAALAALRNKGGKKQRGGLQPSANGGGGGGGGSKSTFMTGVPDEPPRERSGARKGRGERQDKAISGWIAESKRKGAGGASGSHGGWVGGSSGGGGGVSATSARGRNAVPTSYGNNGGGSMRQFKDLRGQMDRRKDEMRKNLTRVGGSSVPVSSGRGRGGTTLPSIQKNGTGRGRGTSSSLTRGSSMNRGGGRSSSNTRSGALPKMGGGKAVRKAW